jgi:hypothetical protein
MASLTAPGRGTPEAAGQGGRLRTGAQSPGAGGARLGAVFAAAAVSALVTTGLLLSYFTTFGGEIALGLRAGRTLIGRGAAPGSSGFGATPRPRAAVFAGDDAPVSIRAGAHAVGPLDTSPGRDSVVFPPRPCGSGRPAGAVCNVVKRIPALDEAMPLAWQPQPALPYVGENHLMDTWRPYSFGCCVVSDAYRFIYVKIAKAAGSTIVAGFLRPAACPVVPPDVGRFVFFDSPSERFSSNCTSYAFEQRDTDCGTCHQIPRWKWLHYFVFASVRHPMARAVSSYSYCGKGARGVPFASWCLNPDTGVGVDCGQTARKPDVHWAAQAPQLCAGGRRCIVDYLVRVENLTAELDDVVTSINAGRDPMFPPLPPYSSINAAVNRQDPATAADRAGLLDAPANAHCRSALAAWYADDFALLGYDPAWPPPGSSSVNSTGGAAPVVRVGGGDGPGDAAASPSPTVSAAVSDALRALAREYVSTAPSPRP